MNARTIMQRLINDSRQSIRTTSLPTTAIAVVLLSWTSGSTVIAVHPTARRNPPATENPIVRVAKQPLDCSGRYFGMGWGDGYHGCHGSGFRPGADLPPKSSHATRRRVSWYGNTYYDRFDSYNLVHPSDFRVQGRAALRGCDQYGGCDEVGVWDQALSFGPSAVNQYSAGQDSASQDLVSQHSVSVFSGNAPVAVIPPPVIARSVDRPEVPLAPQQSRELPATTVDNPEALAVAMPKPETMNAVSMATRGAEQATDAPKVVANDRGHRLPRVTRSVSVKETRLPPASDSSAGVTSGPSRMPTVGAKPCRVAQFVPAPSSTAPSSAALPVQQRPSRIASASPSARREPSAMQQNPFVR